MSAESNALLKSLSDANIVVYAKTIEDEAIAQIKAMADSPLGIDAHKRIMPDCHAGKGCTIGTTMHITAPAAISTELACIEDTTI